MELFPNLTSLAQFYHHDPRPPPRAVRVKQIASIIIIEGGKIL